MLLALLVVGFLIASAAPAWADGLTPPEATQHALDELANCRAQRRPECPTSTATLTPTVVSTATLTPTPTGTPRPADTPSPTVTPAPSLPGLGGGEATAGYVRPSPLDPSGAWLELALPQGRWAVLYDASLCAAPAPWTNVWLALDDQTGRPITADRDDGATCAVAQSTWSSDVPCAADEQGTCDVAFDDAYGNAIAQNEPTATDTPIPTNTAVPQPTPTPRPPAALAAATSTAEPRVAVVVQTVVGVVTGVPAATPVPSPTRLAASTTGPTPTATSAPTSTNTPTLEPTSTVAPQQVAGVSATQAPTAVADEPAAAPTSWNWTLTFVVVAVALGLIAVWLLVARAGPLMW
jgi:hypothetical protein